MVVSIEIGMGNQYSIPNNIIFQMTRDGDKRSIVNIPERYNRPSYVLKKNSSLGLGTFGILYNDSQSYYTFEQGCQMALRVRRMSAMCYTIKMDGRQVGVVHNFDYYRTGSINITIIENPSDPYSNTTIYFIPQIDMKRFMFQIFSIEQTENHLNLIAQINPIFIGSTRLPIPDAYTFTVNLMEEISDKEKELALILSITINGLRNYRINDDDNKEDFYNSD